MNTKEEARRRLNKKIKFILEPGRTQPGLTVERILSTLSDLLNPPGPTEEEMEIIRDTHVPESINWSDGFNTAYRYLTGRDE